VKIPLYMFDEFADEKVTSNIPRFLNWRLSSCLARAAVLLFINCLQESVKLVGMVLLSMADAKRSILVVDSCKFLTLFLNDPSFSTLCSNCFVRIVFCNFYSSTWQAMLALRRLSTPT
jgi:hypothetical protein